MILPPYLAPSGWGDLRTAAAHTPHHTAGWLGTVRGQAASPATPRSYTQTSAWGGGHNSLALWSCSAKVRQVPAVLCVSSDSWPICLHSLPAPITGPQSLDTMPPAN